MKTLENLKMLQQQRRGLGQLKEWSWIWNAKSWVGFENGVFFSVLGKTNRIRSTVRITLMPENSYRIEFIQARLVLKEYIGVRFDEMVPIIEEYVR